MEISPQNDLKGEDLKSQRFQLLEDIAADLSSGEVVFPVCFELHQRIRKMLDEDDLPLERLAAQIGLEPLIDAKLLQIANSAAYNQSGPEIRDLKTAIVRLGFRMVRNVAMAITMNQMLCARSMVEFNDLAKHLWEHSLRVACAARVIAQRKTRINPDEAMLAGLVHDIGAFYMLYRAAQYEELRQRPDTLKYLIMRWHESIGESVLFVLGMPEEIIEAVHDHDQPRDIFGPIRKFNDVIYVGNILAGGLFEWRFRDQDNQDIDTRTIIDQYQDLEEEIRNSVSELQGVMG